MTGIHSVNTRHAADCKLRIPKLSTTTGQRSFRDRGVKAWNNVPTSFKNSNLTSLKKLVIESLLSIIEGHPG